MPAKKDSSKKAEEAPKDSYGNDLSGEEPTAADHAPEGTFQDPEDTPKSEADEVVDEERARVESSLSAFEEEYRRKNPVAAAETPGHKGGPSSTDHANQEAEEYNQQVMEDTPDDLKEDDSKATGGKGGENKFGEGTEDKYGPTT